MPRGASPEVLREQRPTAGRRGLYQRRVGGSDRAWQRVAHRLAQAVRANYDGHNVLPSRDGSASGRFFSEIPKTCVTWVADTLPPQAPVIEDALWT